MAPALRSGDWLLVDVQASAPRPGEIWCCHITGRVVAHRIVSVEERDGRTWIRSCSDGGRLDPWTDSTIGRVVLGLREGKLFDIPRRPLRRRLAWLRRTVAGARSLGRVA